MHTLSAYITQLYIMSTQPADKSGTSDKFIWLKLEKKSEAVNAYLINYNQGWGIWGGVGWGESLALGGSESLYKLRLKLINCDESLQWQSLENLSVSPSLRPDIAVMADWA